MIIIKYPNKNEWKDVLKRPEMDFSALQDKVRTILNDVMENGDRAVIKYTRQFDQTSLKDLKVSGKEMKEAGNKLTTELKEAIMLAKDNIEKFHKAQQTKTLTIETMPGVTCWQKSVAIEKVGLYIPGGTAPLFSTVLMLAVPAKIAGCKEIILCSPPDKDGKLHPAILYAAKLAGVTTVYKAGGVQAIGAMAYGTETIPKVYKIFGPGNQYVTAAKQYAGMTGTAIDIPAGPSEVAVMIDYSCNTEFVAADLLAQAEHGADSQVLLVAADEQLIIQAIDELYRQVEWLPRRDMAMQAIEDSKAVVLKDETEMIALINEYAPEHLIIAMKDPNVTAEKIVNAGSVFIGNYTPESIGDYTSGTNHTLPTNGFAKMYSGVNLDSFVKKITFQEVTRKGIQNIGQATEIMAEAENLTAHKNAVTVRLKTLKKK